MQNFVSDFALEARFAGGKKWYPGKVTKVNAYADGTRTYDFRYTSGMRERGVPRHYIRRLRPPVKPTRREKAAAEARRLRRADPRLAVSLRRNSVAPTQVDLFNKGLLSVKALRTTAKHGHDAHQARAGRLPKSRPGLDDPGYGGIKVGSRVRFYEPVIAADRQRHTHGDVVALNSDCSVDVKLGACVGGFVPAFVCALASSAPCVWRWGSQSTGHVTTRVRICARFWLIVVGPITWSGCAHFDDFFIRVTGDDMILVSVLPELVEVVAQDEPDVVSPVNNNGSNGSGATEPATDDPRRPSPDGSRNINRNNPSKPAFETDQQRPTVSKDRVSVAHGHARTGVR